MGDIFPAPEEPAGESAVARHLEYLRGELATRARLSGVVDVVYGHVDTRFGRLLVAETERGVVRLAFEGEDDAAVIGELADRIGPRVLRDETSLAETAREVREYLDGVRREFSRPVDLRLASGFRRTVLRHLMEIAYGESESYSEVAHAVGNARAARAAGTACARNPVPLLVPCHRVVRADGSSGSYRGGPGMKADLLAMESGR